MVKSLSPISRTLGPESQLVRTVGPHTWSIIMVGSHSWSVIRDGQISFYDITHTWSVLLVHTFGPNSQLGLYHSWSKITVGPEHTLFKSTLSLLHSSSGKRTSCDFGPPAFKDQLRPFLCWHVFVCCHFLEPPFKLPFSTTFSRFFDFESGLHKSKRS